MKKLFGMLILMSLVMLTGCPQFRSNFLGEEFPIPTYLPNENCKVVAFSPGQEPEGFNGIKWDTNVSSLAGMKPYRKDASHGGIDFYLKEKENFKLGNGTFQTIQYGFWRGRFYTGVVTIEGIANFNSLKEGVFSKFGQGAKPFRNKEEYLWVGKDAVMSLRYDEFTKSGIFYIRSDTMAKKMEQDRAQTISQKSARVACLLLLMRSSL
jgi:hypothetical protein